jgi:hypothetical protein
VRVSHLPSVRKTGVNDLAMDPKDPNILYAGARQRQRRRWNDPRVEVGFSEGGRVFRAWAVLGFLETADEQGTLSQVLEESGYRKEGESRRATELISTGRMAVGLG